MGRIFSEEDITWSSIEKHIPYKKVLWTVQKNGIPAYTFVNENDEKMDINEWGLYAC